VAYEIKPWKEEGCDLVLEVSDISRRETFSREINEVYGEGGGLNANYQTVEAVAIVANALGERNGFKYGKQFIFKTGSAGQIIFDFDCPENRDAAQRTIEELTLPLQVTAA